MSYAPVTVNDAIQRTFNNPSMFNWWGGAHLLGVKAVDPANNPVLRSLKMNQVPTWKDWCLILGGGGHVLRYFLMRLKAYLQLTGLYTV